MILRALMHENPNNNNVLKALKKKEKKSVHVSALVCLEKKGIEKGQCNPPKKRKKNKQQNESMLCLISPSLIFFIWLHLAMNKVWALSNRMSLPRMYIQ